MIKSLVRLSSNLQATSDSTAKEYLAYAAGELITRTMPRWYTRQFMSFNNFNAKGSKPYLTLSFDCDLREDIEAYPSLIKLLAKHKIKASFAVVGKWIEQYPEEHKFLLAEGHEIVNHTYTHPNNPHFNPHKRFTELSYEEQKEEIQRFDEVCQELLDYQPVGFRIPHLCHTQTIYPILKELNYRYSSSTIATRTPNFGMPYAEDDITEFPLSPCPKMKGNSWSYSRR